MASASAVPSRNAVAYLTISSYCLRISSQSIGRDSTGCRLGYPLPPLKVTNLKLKWVDLDPLIEICLRVRAIFQKLSNRPDRVRFEQHEHAGLSARVVENGASETNSRVERLHHMRAERRFQGLVLGLNSRSEASDT